MSLVLIPGTFTALWQSFFNNDIMIYAYVEISKPDRERVLIEKVAVCSDVASRLRLGHEGEFFIDRIFKTGSAAVTACMAPVAME